ncbi:MAG TPA: CoB--CoM heterodisulfide reductase subunit B [Thermoplasmata archaeon]|nr:CoB--CoM heterodisulfide reductase subunit B [Thermoplasmata archaeon]
MRNKAKYGLYLGCIAPLRYPGIESSTREVLKKLGIDFIDLEGVSCCPAPGVVRSFDIETWLALGARNLSIAEEKRVEMLTICNGCFDSLYESACSLDDEKTRKRVNDILVSAGVREYQGTTKVRHEVEVLYNEVGLEKIRSLVVNKLDLKVAVHYGCHFLSPSKYKKIDDPERPTILDDLVEATNAKSVSYRDKQACCGAGGGVRARLPQVALAMTEEKLKNITEAKADCIVTPCPFCHLQFDRGQKEMNYKYTIPVLHISQLLGLAFGINKEKLGFESHYVPVKLPARQWEER